MVKKEEEEDNPFPSFNTPFTVSSFTQVKKEDQFDDLPPLETSDGSTRRMKLKPKKTSEDTDKSISNLSVSFSSPPKVEPQKKKSPLFPSKAEKPTIKPKITSVSQPVKTNQRPSPQDSATRALLNLRNTINSELSTLKDFEADFEQLTNKFERRISKMENFLHQTVDQFEEFKPTVKEQVKAIHELEKKSLEGNEKKTVFFFLCI